MEFLDPLEAEKFTKKKWEQIFDTPCRFETKSNDVLSDHIKNKHERYPCKECQRVFPSNTLLKEHIRKDHEQDALFECENCKYDTIIENNLIEHIKSMHDTDGGRKLPKFNKYKSEKLCIFWNHGFCRNEDLCKFVHEEIPACIYQEKCWKEKCSFFHYNTSQNAF